MPKKKPMPTSGASDALATVVRIGDALGLNWGPHTVAQILADYINLSNSGNAYPEFEDWVRQRAEEEAGRGPMGRWHVDFAYETGQVFADHKWTACLVNDEGCVVAIGGSNNLRTIADAMNRKKKS